MRLAIIITFLLLFMLNSHICTYFYPTHEADYYVFLDWYFLRDKIYEVMFLLAILIPLTKPTKLSKAVAAGGVILILSSVADKVLQEIFTSNLRDWMVIVPAAVFVAFKVYKNGRTV